jgi:hypothetical protein
METRMGPASGINLIVETREARQQRSLALRRVEKV